MSKKAYSAWDYPSNTKRNPIPPAKSSQERNRGVGIPQSQQSTAPLPQNTTPAQRGIVPERGQNARQNYTPPTRGRPASTGAQPWLRNSDAGKQTPGTTGTARRTGTTGTAGQTRTGKPTGTTGKLPYRSSYASAADLADMNEIMGVSSYTGEAQDVADEFLRQNGVSGTTEYQKKFFTEQARKQQEREARRRAQEERARQYRELYGDEEAAAEYMGLRGGYTGEVDDLVQEEWRKNGVSDAAGYRKVADYRWRNMAGGAVDTLRNSANDLSYRLQDGRAEQLAENDAMRDAANGKGNYEDLYRYYLAKYQKETENFVPVKAVDWGEAYNAETARIADEEGFNDYVRKDGELSRALGAMAPSLALSAAGNVASNYMLVKGAYQTAKTAARVGKALSASMTFSSASGAAYENAIANGIDPEKAMRLATAAGVIELGTEAISSGLGSVAGKKLGIGGAGDQVMKSLVGRVTEDPLVQNALLYMGDVLGEGFEEMLSEWGNYAADKIIGGYDTRTIGEVWGDSWEAFRDGAFISGILNTTSLLKKGVPPQTAIEVGIDEAIAQDNASPRKDAVGRKPGTTVSISEIVGKISDSLRQKLPERDLVQFNEAFENSPAGNRLSEALAGMDTADAARLTEAVTGAVADAVKRGESYSSLEDFLTDESVERMTEAVIEEAAETLGLADADDTGVNEKKLGDSRVAALKDMAKESLTDQFRKDGELRDTAERVRQARRESATRSDRIIERIERGERNDYLDGIPVKHYGETVVFPKEYGTIYSNGNRYEVSIGPYSEDTSVNKQLGLPGAQSHHVAQNASFKSVIPKLKAIAISVEGDVIRDPKSQHAQIHGAYEMGLDVFRAAGTRPTYKEYLRIVERGIQTIGLSEAAINYTLYTVVNQWLAYGIDLDTEIPKMPRKMYFPNYSNSISIPEETYYGE